MSDERSVLRAIDWRGLFPWLVIFRTFSLAASWPLLLLATAGVVLTPLGWHAAHLLFVSESTLSTDPQLKEFVDFNNRWPGQVAARSDAPGKLPLPDPAGRVLFRHAGDVEAVYQRLTLPFKQLFSRQWSIAKFAYFLFGGLWTLLVWSFCGGAITRIAAMNLGREERVGLREAAWFALRKLVAYLTAPLFPLLAVFLLALLIAAPSIAMRLDLGVVVAGIAWPLAILASFIMTLLLTGLLFGWPLMWCTVSVEGTDPFDALARAYAYVFQRPLHYLFYALLAVLFGALSCVVVFAFAEAMVELTFWAATWGAGNARVSEILVVMQGTPPAPGEEPGRLLWIGAGLLNLSVGLVRAVATAFSFSLFWCLATAIYLLLRHDVDQTEFDEVYLEDAEEPYGLPPLRPDRHGVPLVPDNKPPPLKPKSPDPEPSGNGGETRLPGVSIPIESASSTPEPSDGE